MPIQLSAEQQARRKAYFDNKKTTAPDQGSYADDIGSALKTGARSIPGIATGLGDAALGAAFNANRPLDRMASAIGRRTGFQPSLTQEAPLSAGTQRAEAAVDAATGFGDTLSAYIDNPRAIGTAIARSAAPSVLGGVGGGVAGAVARSAVKRGGASTTTKALANPFIAAGAGEGAVIAGAQMDDLDRSVDPRRAGLSSLAAGIGGGLIGGGGAKIASKLGVGDLELLFQGGRGKGVLPLGAQGRGIVGRIIGGAGVEGILQEMPQSTLEGLTSNWAEEKPLMEGLGKRAAEGLVTGMGMGAIVGPFGGYRGRSDTTSTDLLGNQETPQQSPPTGGQQESSDLPEASDGSTLQTMSVDKLLANTNTLAENLVGLNKEEDAEARKVLQDNLTALQSEIKRRKLPPQIVDRAKTVSRYEKLKSSILVAEGNLKGKYAESAVLGEKLANRIARDKGAIAEIEEAYPDIASDMAQRDYNLLQEKLTALNKKAAAPKVKLTRKQAQEKAAIEEAINDLVEDNPDLGAGSPLNTEQAGEVVEPEEEFSEVEGDPNDVISGQAPEESAKADPVAAFNEAANAIPTPVSVPGVFNTTAELGAFVESLPAELKPFIKLKKDGGLAKRGNREALREVLDPATTTERLINMQAGLKRLIVDDDKGTTAQGQTLDVLNAVLALRGDVAAAQTETAARFEAGPLTEISFPQIMNSVQSRAQKRDQLSKDQEELFITYFQAVENGENPTRAIQNARFAKTGTIPNAKNTNKAIAAVRNKILRAVGEDKQIFVEGTQDVDLDAVMAIMPPNFLITSNDEGFSGGKGSYLLRWAAKKDEENPVGPTEITEVIDGQTVTIQSTPASYTDLARKYIASPLFQYVQGTATDDSRISNSDRQQSVTTTTPGTFNANDQGSWVGDIEVPIGKTLDDFNQEGNNLSDTGQDPELFDDFDISGEDFSMQEGSQIINAPTDNSATNNAPKKISTAELIGLAVQELYFNVGNKTPSVEDMQAVAEKFGVQIPADMLAERFDQKTMAAMAKTLGANVFTKDQMREIAAKEREFNDTKDAIDTAMQYEAQMQELEDTLPPLAGSQEEQLMYFGLWNDLASKSEGLAPPASDIFVQNKDLSQEWRYSATQYNQREGDTNRDQVLKAGFDRINKIALEYGNFAYRLEQAQINVTRAEDNTARAEARLLSYMNTRLANEVAVSAESAKLIDLQNTVANQDARKISNPVISEISFETIAGAVRKPMSYAQEKAIAAAKAERRDQELVEYMAGDTQDMVYFTEKIMAGFAASGLPTSAIAEMGRRRLQLQNSPRVITLANGPIYSDLYVPSDPIEDELTVAEARVVFEDERKLRPLLLAMSREGVFDEWMNSKRKTSGNPAEFTTVGRDGNFWSYIEVDKKFQLHVFDPSFGAGRINNRDDVGVGNLSVESESLFGVFTDLRELKTVVSDQLNQYTEAQVNRWQAEANASDRAPVRSDESVEVRRQSSSAQAVGLRNMRSWDTHAGLESYRVQGVAENSKKWLLGVMKNQNSALGADGEVYTIVQLPSDKKRKKSSKAIDETGLATQDRFYVFKAETKNGAIKNPDKTNAITGEDGFASLKSAMQAFNKIPLLPVEVAAPVVTGQKSVYGQIAKPTPQAGKDTSRESMLPEDASVAQIRARVARNIKAERVATEGLTLAQITRVVNGSMSQSRASLTQRPVTQATTTEAVLEALDKYVARGVKGKVRVVQNWSELEEYLIRNDVKVSGNAGGFVHNGNVFFIADNIQVGNEGGVVMHEVGVHMNMSPNDIRMFADTIRNMSSSNPLAQHALDAVDASMASMLSSNGKVSSFDVDHEVVAYFVEHAVNSGIDPMQISKQPGVIGRFFRRLVAFVRRTMTGMGFTSNYITAQDIVDAAWGAADTVFREPTDAASVRMSLDASVKGLGRSTDAMLRNESQGAENMFSSLSHYTRKALAPFTFGHDIQALAQKFLPSAAEYFAATERVTYRRGEFTQETAQALKGAETFTQKQRDEVNTYLLDSQTVEAWGFEKNFTGKIEPLKVDEGLRQRYEAMTQTQQDVIFKIFAVTAKQRREQYDVLRNEISKAGNELMNREQDPVKRDAIEDQTEQDLAAFDEITGPQKVAWLHLKREGDYAVVFISDVLRDQMNETAPNAPEVRELKKDGAHYRVEFVSNDLTARNRATELQKEVGEAGKVQQFLRNNLPATKDAIPFYYLNVLRANTEKDSQFDEFGDPIAGSVTAQSQMKAWNRAYIQSLSDTSTRKAELERVNIAGASEDMIGAFTSYSQALSGTVAGIELGRSTSTAIQKMRTEQLNSPDRSTANIYLNQILAKQAQDLDVDSASTSVGVNSVMATTSFFMLLSSPAYYMINSTQPWMLTLPHIAGQFNDMSGTASRMTANYSTMNKAWRSEHKGNFFKSFGGELADIEVVIKEKGEGYRDLMESLVRANLFDIGLDSDMGKFTGNGNILGKMHGFLTHGVRSIEVFNRGVTALTAFEMAKKNPSKLKSITDVETGKSRKQTAEEYAIEEVRLTQGDYGAANAPSIINKFGGLTKMMTQFRKFQLIQISLLVRMLGGWAYGLTAEEKAVGRRQLGYVLATHGIAGGLLGLPMMNIAGAAVASVFGDEDEPANFEVMMRKQIGNDSISDMFLKGLPAWGGIDVSSRVGMGYTFSLMPFTDISFSKEGIGQGMLALFGGPTVAQTLMTVDGLEMMSNGDYTRGAIYAMPKGIKSMGKAYLMGTDGIKARNAARDTLMSPEEFSYLDLGAQFVGLPSTRVSNMQNTNRWLGEVRTMRAEKIARMKGDFVRAFDDNDYAEQMEIRSRWREFNRNQVRLGYKYDSAKGLMDAVKASRRNERLTKAGVKLTKEEYSGQVTDIMRGLDD